MSLSLNLVAIFGLQFILTLTVLAVLASWYLVPWLRDKPMRVALGLLILPHAFRHIGMSFLVPGLTGDALPTGFANATAYGDLLSGLLAIAALVALRYRWRLAIPIAWVFSVVGTTDLLYALSQENAIPLLGTVWLIPTFVVPGLLITHWLVLVRLAAHARHVLGRNESLASQRDTHGEQGYRAA